MDMQQRFYGLTTTELRQMAFQVAEYKGVAHPFDQTKKMAGRHWLAGFLARNGTLSIREPEATSINRAVGFNKAQVDNFFEIWRSLLESIGPIDGDRIWNMDESGLTVVHKPGRIVAKKGQKQVGKVTSGEKGKTVTIICSMSASGRYLAPFMIYPRKKMNEHLLVGCPPGTVGVVTDSGWTDSKVFVQWLNHFVDAVKPTPAKKVVLFVDGHISHKSLEAVELARANGVELISFPPHTTHRLQPLDKCYFGPLKEYYRQACDYWMTSNAGKRITFYNIAALFGAAYTRACTIDKAVSGFSSCGLWPFNPAVFRDADFAPSLMTDSEQAAPASSAPPAVTAPNEIVASEPLPSSAHVEATNLSERATLPDAVASTSTGRTTPMTPINTFIHGISPLPKAGPRLGKRRSQSAEHLTSSPYKDNLREKHQQLNEKLERQANKQTCKKSNKRELHKGKERTTVKHVRKVGATPTNEEYRCIYCSELYTTPPTEDWLQCPLCRQWYHEKCGNEKSACDLCMQ